MLCRPRLATRPPRNQLRNPPRNPPRNPLRYIGKVISGVRADRPCYRLQFSTSEFYWKSEFYLNDHEKFTESEKGKYLNNPNVMVLELGGETAKVAQAPKKKKKST